MIMAIAFTVSCNAESDILDYGLITEECGFVTVGEENVIELGTELDITALQIETVFGIGGQSFYTAYRDVTESMITGDYSTDTVGERNIVISFDEGDIEFTFYVRYGVKFMVGDEVVSQQYLDDGESPKLPSVSDKAPEGMHFAGWSPAIPAEIGDNMVFRAEFAANETAPALEELSAAYGQTLSTLTLPANSYGSWRFVDDGETAVGNVGKNEFSVVFVTSADGEELERATVTVNVSKAKLDFDDIVTSFVYDGSAKYPTYTVPDGVAVMQMGERETNVGTYDFTLLVNSDNYEGIYIGEYTISKASAEIVLGDYELDFEEANDFYPTEYEVRGVSAELLGDVTLVKPYINGAGEYQITVAYDNTENVDVTVINGRIIVSATTFDPGVPTIVGRAYYEDVLSDIALSEHGSGTWSWKDPTLSINTAGVFGAYVVFTPNNAAGYNTVEKYIEIPVAKKTLEITVTADSFVYDSEAKSIEYVIGNGSYTDVTVDVVYKQNNVVVTPINAGTYDVYLNVNTTDERYTGSLTTSLVIAKATPNVDFEQIFDGLTWSESGRTLENIDLPVGYSWIDETTVIEDTNIDTLVMYPAKYTPADTENYEIIYGEFGVVLNKALATITASPSYNLSYNGAVQTLGIFANHTESSLVYTDKNGEEFDINSIKNVGTYEFTVSLAESAHYSVAESVDVTVIISPSEFSDYEMPAGLTATFGDALGSVELPTAENGAWSWKTPNETVGNAGTNVKVAIFTPVDDNYAPFEVNVELSISKKMLELTVKESSFVYSGEEQSAVIEITGLIGADNVVLDGVAAAVNVGNYPFNATVNDDNYSGSVSGTLVISKAKYTPETAPALLYATYGDKLFDVELPWDASGEWSWSSIDYSVGTAVGNAGIRGFKAIFVHNNNNYDIYETIIDISVAKKQIVVPADTSVVYNGSEQRSAYANTDLYTVINAKGVGVGEYTVSFVLRDSDNYEWKDGISTAIFEITKADNVWTVAPTVDKLAWTFGEASAILNKGVALFGEVEVTVSGEEYTEMPTNAGEYTLVVKVIGNDNYEGLEEIFEISVAKKKIAVPAVAASAVYTGAELSATLPAGVTLYTIKANAAAIGVGRYAITLELADFDNYEWLGTDGAVAASVFEITKATNAWVTVPSISDILYGGTLAPVADARFGAVKVEYKAADAYDTEYSETVPTDFGSYVARFTVEGTDDYTALSATVEFSIAGVENAWITEPTISKTEWVFGDEPAIIDAGEAAWGEVIVGAIPTEAGKYTVVVKVVGNDNYTGLEKSFEITISKKKVALPAEDISVPYNGNEQKTEYESTDIYTVENAKGTNVGTYTATFTLTDIDNYEWADGNTVKLTITKATNAWTTEPSVSKTEWTYGDEAATLISGAATFGNVVVTVNGEAYTEMPTDAGTYTIVAKVVGNDNFAGLDEKSFTVTINKKSVDLPTEYTSVVYNGKEQKTTFANTALYTVANAKGTAVGTYTVTFTLTDTDNYEWLGTDGSVAASVFEITKATNAWTTAPSVSKTEWTYGDDVATLISGAAKFGSVEVTIDNETYTAMPTNAGTYAIVVKVVGNDNYEGLEEIFEITVAKKKIAVPAVAASAVYTGAELSAILPEGTTLYAIKTGASATTVGKYDITIELTDTANYEWESASGATAASSFEITRADNAWTVSPSVPDIVFGDALNTAYASLFGAVKIEYRSVIGSDDDYTETAPTAYGEYYARFTVEGTDNYTALSTVVEFTIAGATNTWITAPTISKTEWTYGDEVATLVSGESEFGTVVVTVNGETYTEMPTDAGSYVIVVKVVGNNDFTGLEERFEITISKKKVDLPAGDTAVVYNGNEQKTEYESTDIYTVENAKGTSVGTYTANFTLTDADNYEWADGNTVKLTITKADNAWTTAPSVSKTEWTYGDEVATLISGVAKFGDVVVTVNGEAYTEMPTDAGSYTVVVKVVDNDNFAGLEESFEITVAKKKIAVPDVVSTTVYNGKAQQATLPEGTTLYAIKTNAAKTNVGTYGIVIVLTDADNYEWETTTDASVASSFEITKADNEWTTEPSVSKTEWTYGDDVATLISGASAFGSVVVTLDGEEYTAMPTNAGTYTIVVKVVGNDNYEGLEETFEITVAKKSIAVPTIAANTVYNGAEQTATLPEGTTLYTIKTGATGTVAGDYLITLVLTDADNYEWFGVDSAEAESIFEITKAGNAWITEPTISKNTWKYGAEAATLSYAAKFGTVKVTLNGEEISGALPSDLDADEYTLVFSVEGTDNYDGLAAVEIKFTVTQIIVQTSVVPTTPFRTTYDGKPHKAGATAGVGYTVVDAEHTDAGTYKVTYKLDGSNYIWSDTTADDKTADFIIDPKPIAIPDGTYSKEYNSEQQTAGAVAGEGYTVEDIGGINAGTYAVTYKLIGTNYVWDMGDGVYSSDDQTVDCFTITKIKVTPTAIMTTVPYSGAQNSAISDNTLYTVIGYVENDRVNVGEYTVNLALTDTVNYEWADGVSTTKLVVEKATPVLSDPTIQGWTYGTYNAVANAPGATVSNITGNGIIQYSFWNGETEITDLAGLYPGTYTLRATVADCDNYAGAETETTFNVLKISVSIPTVTLSNNTYTGSAITATVPASDYYDVTSDTTFVNAGDHNVTLTLKNSTIYKWDGIESADVNVKVTIAKAQTTAGVTISGWTYDNTKNAPTFTGVKYDATITYRYAGTTFAGATYDSDVAPTNAGNYEVTVTVTGTDNCIGSSATAAFTIAKKQLDLPSGTYSASYTGEVQYPNVGALYTVAGVTNAGTHSVAVAIKDTSNYEWSAAASAAEKVVTFTISKETTTLTITAPNADYTASPYNKVTYESNVSGATVIYHYYSDAALTNKLSGAPTERGTYYVVAEIAETDNFTGIVTSAKEFAINKAVPTLSFGDYTTDAWYQNNLKAQGIEYSATGIGGVALSGSFSYDKETIKFAPADSLASQTVAISVTFTPTDANYRETTVSVNVCLKPAAYIDTKYYGSIEDALGAAVSGNVVWAVIDVNDAANGGNVISKNCTIPTGVTLLIPYAEGTRNAGYAAELQNCNGQKPTTTNIVTLKSGVTLTVNSGGTLEIGGERHAAGANTDSGSTVGNTARLVLASGAEVSSGGLVNCYGFIDEDIENNGSVVTIGNGGRISMPFIIYDFRGGTATTAINSGGKNAASVFNRFGMVNVVPALVINYGGQVWGMANLFADDKTNSMEAQLVGDNSSTAVIQLTDSTCSKIIAKLDNESKVTKLRVIGGARTNGMSITALGVTANTADFAFAIGYNWDIVLEKAEVQSADATFEMGQLFKLMPGAKLTVSEGTVLNVQNENANAAINVYPKGWEDHWTYTGASGGTSSYISYTTTNAWTGAALEGGMLIVYGTLNADIIGGNVYVNVGATANITTNKCTTKDIATAKWGLLGGSGTFNSMTQDATIIYAFDVTAGATVTLPTLTRDGFAFDGWYTAATGGTKVGEGGASYTPAATITLYAQWTTSVSYTVTFDANGGSCSSSTLTTKSDGTVTLPTPTRDGYTFNGWFTAASGGTSVGGAGATYTPTSDITLYAQWTQQGGSCVTPDTLITLADGTQVRVDELKGDELLLVWNMQTGKLDYAPIMFVDSDPSALVDVIYLYFSDGTVVKVITEHGFWDYDLNKYVYLDEGAAEYIGHYFAKQSGDTLERVRLDDVVIVSEMTTAWSPVTVEHLCYFVNGMLSMPGGVGGLFNIFDVDAETMTYDEEAIQRDIETYGLFTYEELNAIAPLSREMFEAAGGAYMKISIGKGNLTMDELRAMIERYSKYV